MTDHFVRACIRCHAQLDGLRCPRRHVMVTASGDLVWEVQELSTGRVAIPFVSSNPAHSVRLAQWFADKYGPRPVARQGARHVRIKNPSHAPRALASRRRRMRLKTEQLAAVDAA